MRKIIYFLLLLGFGMQSQTMKAQPLSAYYDFQNQFFAWDNGMIRKIDYLIPLEYKIGRYALPYLDNARNFKIYCNGATTKINSGNTNAFYPSDYLVTFQNNTVLQVWENGEITKLSNLCDKFVSGDSLVMFFDRVQSEYRMYYNKEIFTLETFLSGINTSSLIRTDSAQKRFDNMDIANGQIPTFQLSDNIAAYVNFSDQFKIFYLGKLIEQESYPIKSFGVGRNTVTYVDINNEFKVFYKGNTTSIDAYVPYQYQTGDNLVAFIGSDNYFKIFYNDTVHNIGYMQPDFVVVDNIVYYTDQSGYFHVFYKGKDYTLESYTPTEIRAQYNSIAYVSNSRMIKLFTEGALYDVITADVSSWRLDYDVLQYKFGANMNKVFYKGKTY